MSRKEPGGAGPPPHLRPSLVGLVVLGGTLGTALRDRIETAFVTAAGGVPWATFTINVSGAFLLGVLLELLALAGRDPIRRRAVQLTLGTGLLGGYTTYSTFVLETIGLGLHGSVPVAAAYAAASVLSGFAAALVAMGATRAVVRAIEGNAA